MAHEHRIKRAQGITLIQLTVIAALTLVTLMILARQIRLEILEVSQARKNSRFLRAWMTPMNLLRKDFHEATEVAVSPKRIDLVQLDLEEKSDPRATHIRYEIFPDQCLMGGSKPQPCVLLSVTRTRGDEKRVQYFRNFRTISWCQTGDSPQCQDVSIPTLKTGQRLFFSEWDVFLDHENSIVIPLAVGFSPNPPFASNLPIPLRSTERTGEAS